DLVLGLGSVLEPLGQPLGVSDGHHRVELGLAADIVVHEEGLRHRRGISEPGGLDDDGVELALAAHQPVDDAHEIAAHSAADAAVVHLEHFLVGPDHEVVVDADLAELVDDDGVFFAVRLREYAVEQGGLAGAEIAGQHGDGDLVGHRLLRLATVYRHRCPDAIRDGATPAGGTSSAGKDTASASPFRTAQAGTMMRPIGQSASPASLRCAQANGRPMMVMARRMAQTRCPSASHQPASTSQMMLPITPSGPVPTSSWPVWAARGT